MSSHVDPCRAISTKIHFRTAPDGQLGQQTVNFFRPSQSRLLLRSFAHPGAQQDQVVEAVQWFAGCPGNAAQEENPKERVVKRPCVMAGDGDEHPAFALLACPYQGLRFAILNPTGEDLNVGLAAVELPIAFIEETGGGESCGNGAWLEAKFDWSVAKFRASSTPIY
jgi:hypothetical protein